MQIIEMRTADLIPYENNPRKNENAVQYVANSIREFGFKVPIIVDRDNVIVAGHTRLKAAELLGLDVVPVIRADDLTEEQVNAFRLADNKTGEMAEWDQARLEKELSQIDFDMSAFGFPAIPDEDDEEEQDNPYTTKTNVPQYDVQGEAPDLSELVDDEKTRQLLEEIEGAGIGFNEKQFLKKAAQRHLVFNYRKIAEYYAGADPEMQALMEKSALVIIDYNDAIMNGYTRLTEKVKKMLEADKGA